MKPTSWMLPLAGLATAIATASCAVPLEDAPSADPGNSTDKVIAGSDARIEDYPYAVRLFYNGSPWCGASILNDRFLLTAAHCVYNTNATGFKALVGSANVNSGGTRYSIRRAIVHERYSGEASNGNDVALLEVSGKMDLNGRQSDTVSLARPRRGDYYADVGDGLTANRTPAVVVGWGDTTPGYNDSRAATRLQKGERLIDGGWARTGQLGVLDDGGPAACKGDSGGPLVATNSKGQPVQVGVVSWGEWRRGKCQGGNWYARVSTFYDWIVSKVGTLPDGGGTDGGGTDCRDTPGWTDARGYACTDWSADPCDRAQQSWGYSAREERDILTNCAQSCGQCGGGGDPTGCSDNPEWSRGNHTCASWAAGGFDCEDAARWGYSAREQAELASECPVTCGTCDDRPDEPEPPTTSCEDNPRWSRGSHTCASWSAGGYNCFDASRWGYSASEQADLLRQCPVTCGTCDEPEPPTPSCEDNPGWSRGSHTCASWSAGGYNCLNASRWGYSAREQSELLRECPVTCGTCP